jgi:hypothetical protein
MVHECYQEEKLGGILEFIKSMKNTNNLLCGILISIVLQVVTFAFLWGSLTTTVSKNTDYLWMTLSPQTAENTRNIDKILAKFEMVAVTKVHAEGIK